MSQWCFWPWEMSPLRLAQPIHLKSIPSFDCRVPYQFSSKPFFGVDQVWEIKGYRIPVTFASGGCLTSPHLDVSPMRSSLYFLGKRPTFLGFTSDRESLGKQGFVPRPKSSMIIDEKMGSGRGKAWVTLIRMLHKILNLNRIFVSVRSLNIVSYYMDYKRFTKD